MHCPFDAHINSEEIWDLVYISKISFWQVEQLWEIWRHRCSPIWSLSSPVCSLRGSNLFGLTNQGEKWSYGTTHAEMAAIYLYKLFSWALGGWKRKGHRWSHRERELSLPLPTREEIPPSGWQFFIFLSHFAQTFSTRSPINYSRRRLFSEKSLKAVMLLRLIIKSQIYLFITCVHCW